MSTPKSAPSLRKRGLLLLGGALLFALPILATASCVGTPDDPENGSVDDERTSTSDEDALSAIQKHPPQGGVLGRGARVRALPRAHPHRRDAQRRQPERDAGRPQAR